MLVQAGARSRSLSAGEIPLMPLVSIIVPCYNEEATIHLLLDAIYHQSFSRSGMEVVIADGLSTDRTREQIARFHSDHPDLPVRIVDNPRRTIPAGLNCALQAAQGDIVVRLDGHSMPRPDYVRLCVDALMQGLGDNVGGVWEIQPGGTGWQARAIAAAAAHPLAVGDARYRYTGQAQAVDTVPFGAFYRSLVERIGWFDESLLTNEDYEFNTRIRQSGGTVWLDPGIRSTYIARASLSALARQYWRYGYWKARMLRRYPRSLRWRQALPPVFVAGLFVAAVLSIWIPAARWLAAGILLGYGLVIGAVGANLAVKKKDVTYFTGIPFAIATMHLAWGSAFLWSGLGSFIIDKISARNNGKHIS